MIQSFSLIYLKEQAPMKLEQKISFVEINTLRIFEGVFSLKTYFW